MMFGHVWRKQQAEMFQRTVLVWQACNHAVAMLLMVDFQWKVRAVQKACTSLPYTWNQGGKSLSVESKRLADVEIKPVAEKLHSNCNLNSAAKKLFSPNKQSRGMSFDTLLQKLRELKMDSVTLGEPKCPTT